MNRNIPTRRHSVCIVVIPIQRRHKVIPYTPFIKKSHLFISTKNVIYENSMPHITFSTIVSPNHHCKTYQTIVMIFLFLYFQISLLPQNFSLHFNPTMSEDTGEYICLVNDRHSPEEIIDLLVQGEYQTYIYIQNIFSTCNHIILTITARCWQASTNLRVTQQYAKYYLSISIVMKLGRDDPFVSLFPLCLHLFY